MIAARVGKRLDLMGYHLMSNNMFLQRDLGVRRSSSQILVGKIISHPLAFAESFADAPGVVFQFRNYGGGGLDCQAGDDEALAFE